MQELTQSVKTTASAYLMARAFAETQRKAVDAIQREILETANYWSDPKNKRFGDESRIINDPAKAWLLKDSEFRDYLCDVRIALEKAGYEIKQATDNNDRCSYLCPALTAESVQRDAERLLIECGAEMLNTPDPKSFNQKLLCAGLEKRQKFIDLIVGAVVNAPGFKNPLTGKAA